MQAKKDFSIFIKNTLIIFIVFASINVSAETNIANYSEAIVITESKHVLSAHTVILKNSPEQGSVSSIKPQVVTTNYDDLTTIQENASPLQVERASAKHCKGSPCVSNSFMIK